MIHVVSAVNRHLYEDVIEQHFRVRHEIFVEERNWGALRKPDGRDIDDYDNEDTIYLLALDDRRVVGGYRLYPTTKPTMMSEVFPHLAAVRGCPSDPLIWEWSRFFVARDRRDGVLNLQLMAAAQEFCLEQGIERLCLVMETWWLPRFHDIGFLVTPLGLPTLIEESWTMAATIEVRQDSLDVVRGRTGMSQLIRQEGPPLDAIARANLCGLAASLRKTA
ncbi:GNAT family N-acetyltransferase [Bradyrhizobium diazoefficiens]|nr:acyl-homoserine-lactone synthase [Bradyrhizobium diazoefficiens]MBR0852103.1 GNAT family N-acetyltransferase [Bradyrhizobium diazoefficiens]